MTRIGVHDDRNRCSASAESAFTLKRNECSRWTGICIEASRSQGGILNIQIIEIVFPAIDQALNVLESDATREQREAALAGLRNARKKLAAHLAQAEPAVLSGWQPRASAPSDGSAFRAYGPAAPAHAVRRELLSLAAGIPHSCAVNEDPCADPVAILARDIYAEICRRISLLPAPSWTPEPRQ